MLSSFHVENYKCLKNVTLPLTPMHVLIGQNDAGKSSLLEALYAFFRSSQEGLEQAFSGHWQGDDLVYESATEPIVKFEGTFEDFGKYGFHALFARGSGRSCHLVEEWYQRETLAAMAIKSRGKTATKVAAARTNSGPLAEEDIALQQINALLDGVHLYKLDPRLMAIPSELSVRRFRLDRDGFGLPGLLDEILGYDLEQYAKIRSQFLQFFPQYRNLRIETEPATRREFSETGQHNTHRTVGKGIHFETQNHRSIRAQQASDGAILFLGFLALANLPHPPKMLLIEEPETGIYPERLAQVIQLLREIDTAPQIVFTTHSPYVLSLFQPEEVTYMSRGSDGIVRARPLRDAPNIRERLEGFYLGELWYNLSEQELFADA